MRLPRVRFTVAALLVSVAVVAVNCWCLRRLSQTTAVGALPLINVALIGTLVLAARRLRGLLHGRAASPRSSFSGVVYFSLHFLMLGGLVSQFMPHAVERNECLLDAAWKPVALGWAVVFGEPSEMVSWIIFDHLVLGLVVSGPPLFLAWIGQRLATRCARALPRRRFQALTFLVSLGFAMMALAICLAPQPFDDWCAADLDFQVLDEVTGRPIAAAFLCMTDPFSSADQDIPRAITDSGGCARLTGRFVASGQRNAFRTMGVFSPWGRWLIVTAANHRTRRLALTELLGPFADPARPIRRRVVLARGETPTNSCNDVAGLYASGGCWFTIEPDGRFALFAAPCHGPWIEEYGSLKRHGDELEIIPIPHPDRKAVPLVALKYRVIEWGDRLYLSTTDAQQFGRFCRAALRPHPPTDPWLSTGGYLRPSDRDKPQTGLPRLPLKVWLGFLAGEMSLDNGAGSLRRALDSLSRRRSERWGLLEFLAGANRARQSRPSVTPGYPVIAL